MSSLRDQPLRRDHAFWISQLRVNVLHPTTPRLLPIFKYDLYNGLSKVPLQSLPLLQGIKPKHSVTPVQVCRLQSYSPGVFRLRRAYMTPCLGQMGCEEYFVE